MGVGQKAIAQLSAFTLSTAHSCAQTTNSIHNHSLLPPDTYPTLQGVEFIIVFSGQLARQNDKNIEELRFKRSLLGFRLSTVSVIVKKNY